MMILTAWELPGLPNKKRHRFRCLFLSQRKSACNKKSLLWCIEYGILSASRNILLEILRISFFCGWDVKLSIGWSEKVEPQGDFPPAVLPSQASTFGPSWEMLSFLQHLTVTEVKLVFSHIACSPEAIWEDRCKYNGKSTWLPSVRTEMQIHTRLMQIQGTETNSDSDCSLLRPSSDLSPVTQKMR